MLLIQVTQYFHYKMNLNKQTNNKGEGGGEEIIKIIRVINNKK